MCTENLYLQTVLQDTADIENTISVSKMLCLRKEQQSRPVTCHIWTGKRSKSLLMPSAIIITALNLLKGWLENNQRFM